MTTLRTTHSDTFSIDMLRDDCTVIERRAGDTAKLKKAFSKLHKILKGMPASTADTLKDVKKTRGSRGRS